MQGKKKPPAELDYAIESGVGHIVVDSFDEIERLRGRSRRVLLRVTPGIEASTHSFIQTGQVDSKFGFQLDEVERAVPEDVTVLCEPGRALVGNAGVTLYRVGTIKRIPDVRTYVAVDGGMSDNLRPMLYGAQYEAEIADRFGGEDVCTIAGKHCESGDVLVRDVKLDDPRAGDVLVIPATGAYGHAMANNYNGIPRPPVIFCSGGAARVVVRRETLEDLTRRDL